MRLLMTAFVFGIPETKMRCISPEVGGAFGTKIFLYPEYVLVAALAEKTGRPVKWIETRRENYAATTHGRDHVTYLEVGAKRDGTITALKAKTYANLGGVLSTIAPGIPTTLYGRMLSGAYRIPAIHCQVIGVYTNTGMVDAYRGAGRPEATYVVERAVDLVAREARARPGRGPAHELHPARGLPVRPGDPRRVSTTTPATTRSALDRALEHASATRTSGPSRSRRGARGRYLGDRLLDLRRDLRRRAVGLDRHDRAGLGRRSLGERERARPPHRQGRRHDRLASRTARATRRR